MEKSTFLKIMGIIMVVFGALALVGVFMTKSTYSLLGFTSLWVMSIVQVVAMLGSGIIGIMYSGKKEKARFCVICALVLLVLEIIGVVMQYATGYVDMVNTYAQTSGATTLLSTALGFVIPILFFIAAYRFKKKLA